LIVFPGKFSWKPGHAGTVGHKKADKAAMEALQQHLTAKWTVAEIVARAKQNGRKIIEQNWQQSDSPSPMTRLNKLSGPLRRSFGTIWWRFSNQREDARLDETEQKF
jgi:hypothetical protein